MILLALYELCDYRFIRLNVAIVSLLRRQSNSVRDQVKYG